MNAIKSFNLQGALQASLNTSIVGASSRHQCAKAVRMMLEAGGINTSGRPDWAWKYMNYLPTIGFGYIGQVTGKEAQATFTANSARPGDIAVYFKPGEGKNHPGHICIWNGRHWCSDFRQNSMFVYSAGGTAFIYRWNGQVSNFPINLDNVKDVGLGLNVFNPDTKTLNITGEELEKECPYECKNAVNVWSRYKLKMLTQQKTVKS